MKGALRRSAVYAGGIAAVLAIATPARAATLAPPAPSAVGNEAVPAISVSPAYARTGFAVAMAYEFGSGCGQDCVHLWATHDHGASWSRLPATGWQRGLPAIALGPGNREVVLAGGAQVQRSDDGGTTWHTVVTSKGAPDAGPPFGADGTLAVAGQGGQDLLVHPGGSTTPVAGSGGAATDVQFAYAPEFPSSGRYAPLLLSALNTQTGTTLVEQCTATYDCSSPATLATAQKMPGNATLVLSPGYAVDGTVFAVEPTALLKSTDGGRSFAPLTIGAPGAAATSVGSLALDADYATNHVAYAAVLQIFAGKAATVGGVYRTADGGTTWTKVGSPGPMDHGATSLALAPQGHIFAGYVEQGASAAGGLECWDGVAWSAFCGVHGAAPNPRGASSSGGPAATMCGGSGCGQAQPQRTSAAAAGAAPGSDGGDGGTPASLVDTGAGSNGKHLPVLVPVALALLAVLGGGALAAWLRERRLPRQR